jgi:hypothetical protein
MYYVIQENTFNEKGHTRLIEALERLDLPYEIIKVKPFVEELEFKTDRKDVFCFGGTKMARLAGKYGWNPGSLASKNHNFRVYRKFYRDNLLNYRSRIYPIEYEFDWRHPEYFIRPCDDNKGFTGSVFTEEEWKELRESVLEGTYPHSQLTKETIIQVTMTRKIQAEYRLWIVDGKIVTASRYTIGGRVIYGLSEDIDPEAIVFCQRMLGAYQLARAFVMDVCLHEDEWKIVECGCINSAGFYNADMQKLVISLEEAFKW